MSIRGRIIWFLYLKHKGYMYYESTTWCWNSDRNFKLHVNIFNKSNIVLQTTREKNAEKYSWIITSILGELNKRGSSKQSLLLDCSSFFEFLLTDLFCGFWELLFSLNSGNEFYSKFTWKKYVKSFIAEQVFQKEKQNNSKEFKEI